MNAQIKTLVDQAEELLRVAEDLAETLGDPAAFRVMRRRWLVDLSDVTGHDYSGSIVVEARDPVTAAHEAFKEWSEWCCDDLIEADERQTADVYLEPEGLMSGMLSPERHEIGEDWQNGWMGHEPFIVPVSGWRDGVVSE